MPPTDYLSLALNYIQHNFTLPITLYQIADSLKVSPGYLGKLFHDSKGETYAKYITKLRMEHAAYLLKSKGSLRIGQVAELSGYCSVKHFNYVFKEYYGTAPGQYQKLHCSEE